MRTFQETHPWISIKIDTTKFAAKTWLLLGEAESKCEHVAGVALRPEAAQRLHEVYLSKGIHGTTSIEGNTLSEAEVLARVQGELPLPPSREYLGREIDNILSAYNEILRDVVERRPLELTPVNQLPVLSPRVAVAYAGKQQKTISRDVSELRRMQLIRKARGEVVANRAIIRAFLPVRADS